jgi:hypothetical protein
MHLFLFIFTLLFIGAHYIITHSINILMDIILFSYILLYSILFTPTIQSIPAYKERIDCYNILNKNEKMNTNLKENLKYTAEKILCGYTGTNSDCSISYGGSTMIGTVAGDSMVDTGYDPDIGAVDGANAGSGDGEKADEDSSGDEA